MGVHQPADRHLARLLGVDVGLFLPLALTVGVVVGGAFLAAIGTRFARNPAERGQQAN